jgi:hypothetical protein
MRTGDVLHAQNCVQYRALVLPVLKFRVMLPEI